VYELSDGRHVEVFDPGYPGKDHFDTGPVVGIAGRDLVGAVEELQEAGVELLGEPGPTWQHFRGPMAMSTNLSPADLMPSRKTMGDRDGQDGW